MVVGHTKHSRTFSRDASNGNANAIANSKRF